MPAHISHENTCRLETVRRDELTRNHERLFCCNTFNFPKQLKLAGVQLKYLSALKIFLHLLPELRLKTTQEHSGFAFKLLIRTKGIMYNFISPHLCNVWLWCGLKLPRLVEELCLCCFCSIKIVLYKKIQKYSEQISFKYCKEKAKVSWLDKEQQTTGD